MVEVAQRQRTTFPTLDDAVDAAAKYRSDYDKANTEYNRFHARSDPAAQLAEQAAYADPRRMNPTFVNARNPRVYRNTQYSPNYPGNKYTTQFTVGSSGGTGGLESLPRGEYYNRMKDEYDFFMDEMYKPDVRRDMNLEPYPDENNEEVMNVEEEGDGIFNNPLMNELFRLNRERRMEELKRRQLEDWNAEKDWGLNNWDTTRDERYSETIQKLVLDRIINPQNYNSEPGTGDLYPLIADPYWNI